MSITVEKCNLNQTPKCPHGPTVLFSRNGEKFYACSACRDRKDCNFFLYKNELNDLPEHKWKAWNAERKKYTGGVIRTRRVNILNKIRKVSEKNRMYCKNCERFVLPKFKLKHSEHNLIVGISDNLLTRPSYFLEPLDNAKKEAQYLFSESSVKIIVDIVESLKINNVLCIGSPRIHEFIINNRPNLNSLLLDFDRRYHNFYDQSKFCWYNAFNHHFFFVKSRNVFKAFLKGNNDFIIITDPPFGGRVELLSKTINRIDKLFKQLHETDVDLNVMWMFPYFMEPQILNSLPNFKMLDYKVDYDNHPLFNDGPRGRKQGSPVRIFTNINPSLITLPEDQGYKHCKICDRWVSEENKHCDTCDSCTSKDGRTYVHCNVCGRCVKPSWTHCEGCNRCAQVNHECGELVFEQKCFHCNRKGHKKRDCPNVDHDALRKKRNMK